MSVTRLADFPYACHLLTIDKCCILIDAGLKDVSVLPPKIDAILLSHASICYCRNLVAIAEAYPSAVIYATIATAQLALQTLLEQVPPPTYPPPADDDDETSTVPNRAKIDSMYDRIVQIRYAQPIPLQASTSGTVVTAHAAGYTLGGSIWSIRPSSAASGAIVFAIGWNFAQERHLRAGMQLAALPKVACLISDARVHNPAASRKVRESEVLDLLLQCVKKKWNVLIPCEVTVRGLELAVILETLMKENANLQKVAKVYILSKTGQRVCTVAGSMLEWMNESLLREYEDRVNPFDFQYIKHTSNVADIEASKDAYIKIVLCTSYDLETTYSQTLLLQHPRKWVVCLTTPSLPPASPAAHMFDFYTKKTSSKPSAAPVLVSEKMEFTTEVRSGLTKAEMQEYNTYLKQQMRRNKQEALMQQQNKSILDASDSEDSDDEEAAIVTTNTGEVARGSDVLLYEAYDLFVMGLKSDLRPAAKTFPFIEKKRKFDAYGEIFSLDAFAKLNDIAGAGADIKGASTTAATNRPSEIALPMELVLPPTKVKLETKSIALNCRVKYLDLTGWHDGRGITTLIPQIAPKSLVSGLLPCLII